MLVGQVRELLEWVTLVMCCAAEWQQIIYNLAQMCNRRCQRAQAAAATAAAAEALAEQRSAFAQQAAQLETQRRALEAQVQFLRLFGLACLVKPAN